MGSIGSWFFGNATWILAVANFLWLLFKDNTLFSWWWIVGSAVAFIVSLALFIIGGMLNY